MPTPILDVVVLVHDQAGWADICIRSVESFTTNAHRIIVVDNASKEERTHRLLDEVEKRGHTVVRLKENRSFSNGMNAGVAVGTSKYIALLNSDCIVQEGWDAAMIQDLTDKTVGLTGARSNYVSGPQADPSFKGEPPYLVFVCVATKRTVWDAVGPLDEQTFDGFSSEDLDYSWRVKKAGYTLKVSSAYVLHAGSRTLAATTGDALARQRNDAKYNARLIEKWGREHVVAKSKLQSLGLVVTYHPNDWTRVKFLGQLMGLRRSDNVGFQYLQIGRVPIHQARQSAADFAVDNGFDWLVQLDDDATFPPDVVRRLLSHQKDVVTALAYQRRPPHLPCIFEIPENGVMGAPLIGYEHTGLRKVDCSGFHCSVMNTSVFKRLREAGIRQYYGGFENKVGEDFALSLNLRKVGIQMYCDTELIAGHIGDEIVVDEAYKREFDARQEAR